MPACDFSEMEQPPCQPCRKAGDRALPPFSNTDTPSNRRELARKELPRRCRLLVPRDSSGNELAHVPALMLSDKDAHAILLDHFAQNEARVTSVGRDDIAFLNRGAVRHIAESDVNRIFRCARYDTDA